MTLPARLVFLGRLEDLAVAPGPLEQVLAGLPRELAVALLVDRVRLALNGRLLAENGEITLGEGDELAFLPPVSGG